MPNRARAARARRCARQETAIEPSTGSTPEFWKFDVAGPARRPMADEQHDRNCPMRSSSPRNCARHDSHPCARAGAIAVKHPARAPREILQKRTPPQTRARNYLNARMCSLHRELVSGSRVRQEISLVAICPPHWQLCDDGRPLLVPSFAPRCDSRLERNMMISSRAFRCCLRTDALRPFSVFEVSIFIGED